MAEEAGVEVHLVELDVADDDSVRDGLRPHPRRGRRRSTPRQQRRRRRQRRRRGGHAVAVPRRDERQPVRRRALPPGRAAADARAAAAARSSTSRRSPGGSRRSPSRRTSRRSAPSRGSARAWPRSWRRSASASSIIEPGVTKSAIFAKSIDAPNDDRRLRRAVPADVPVLRRRHRQGDRPVRGRRGHPPRHQDRRRRSCATPVSWGGTRARRRPGRRSTTPTGSPSAPSTTTPSTTPASASTSASTSPSADRVLSCDRVRPGSGADTRDQRTALARARPTSRSKAR